jgi:hypothetical protein
MANESVAATTTQPIDIDGASLRLSNAYAIADLLSECNQDQLCKGTLSGIAYMLMELLSETKDLITGKTEAQP